MLIDIIARATELHEDRAHHPRAGGPSRSGGVIEEATVMGVPWLTLRASIERPETVTQGTNELPGTDPAELAPAFERLFAGQWMKGSIPQRCDGHSAQRTVQAPEGLLRAS